MKFVKNIFGSEDHVSFHSLENRHIFTADDADFYRLFDRTMQSSNYTKNTRKSQKLKNMKKKERSTSQQPLPH